MTSNLVGFTIITFATVTWSLPPFNSQFKPSLHERHNDEIYNDNVEILPRNHLVNTKFPSRRFIDKPDRESKPIKQPCKISQLKRKLEDVFKLFKTLLEQGSKFAKSLSESIPIRDSEKTEKNCNSKKNKKKLH